MNKPITTNRLHPALDRSTRKFDIVTTNNLTRPAPKERESGKRYLDAESDMITTHNIEKIQARHAEEARVEENREKMEKVRAGKKGK